MGPRLAEAIAFLLATAVGEPGAGDDLFTLKVLPAPLMPEGAIDCGTTTAVDTGGIVISMETGTGPSTVQHFVGWMAAAGS
jgi:hypothetical protein